MKSLLTQFITYFEQSEEFQRELTALERAIKSKEWQFFKTMLLSMQGIMANDMLSKKYTNLDPTEKDVTQRTYYNINQMLMFFMNPLRWVKKRSKWKEVLRAVPNSIGKGMPNLTRKEKADGRRGK